MATYMVRRLIQAIPIIIGISLISFLIVYLTPGSPVDKFRTPRVSPATIQNLIRLYGLDQPLPIQFWNWFTHFWTFPFDNLAWGYSFTDGRPVRDKIFQRFWRADTSRARDTGGSGLGLAIVSGIVAAHRGRVEVIDTPGGGATFRVWLPLVPRGWEAPEPAAP